MDSANNSIHEWLANVPNDSNASQHVLLQAPGSSEQQTSGPHRIDDGVAPGAPGYAEDLPIAAKTHQATAQNPGHETALVCDKRTREGPMGIEDGLDLLTKGKKRKREDIFERRPRHKTREDRYEYKGSNIHNQHQSSSKGRTRKRKRQSRWHTMNDEFHASNVARERLTVSSNSSYGRRLSNTPQSCAAI